MKFNQKYPNLKADLKWIAENKRLFNDLIPGKIYTAYENDEVGLDVKHVRAKYKTIKQHKVNGKMVNATTKRVSDKGNFFVKKIAICKCGAFKASNKMRIPTCYECIRAEQNKKMTNRYHSNKKQPSIYTTRRAKKQFQEPVIIPRNCSHCAKLKTYCKDVMSCLTNADGVLRLVPRDFEQNVRDYGQRKGKY